MFWLSNSMSSFLTRGENQMAVSADELNGYRRDRYFARSWALLTMEKGWWKPVLIMALFCLIPVI